MESQQPVAAAAAASVNTTMIRKVTIP